MRVVDWVFDGRPTAQGYSDHDLATTAPVVSRWCPHCHARPGTWCVNKGTDAELAHLDQQHIARRMWE